MLLGSSCMLTHTGLTGVLLPSGAPPGEMAIDGGSYGTGTIAVAPGAVVSPVMATDCMPWQLGEAACTANDGMDGSVRWTHRIVATGSVRSCHRS